MILQALIIFLSCKVGKCAADTEGLDHDILIFTAIVGNSCFSFALSLHALQAQRSYPPISFTHYIKPNS